MKKEAEGRNLRCTGKYAACLFAVQFIIGFTQGLLLTPSGDFQAVKNRFIADVAASVVVSAAVFSVLALRHSERRWLQAAQVFILYTAISVAFAWLVGIWLESSPAVLAFIEWLALLLGAVLGTAIGALFGRRCARSVAGIET